MDLIDTQRNRESEKERDRNNEKEKDDIETGIERK